MNKEKWNRAAPDAGPMVDESSEMVSEQSNEQLMIRGWCLWKCGLLEGEVIVVVIDETVTGFPAGYPVYTSQELLELSGMDDPVVKLIHVAKKEAGAVLACS